MTLTIPWSHVDSETGDDTEYRVEVEVGAYRPASRVTHLRPEDCYDDPGELEILTARRVDTHEDIWPRIEADDESRHAFREAVYAELERGQGVAA